MEEEKERKVKEQAKTKQQSRPVSAHAHAKVITNYHNNDQKYAPRPGPAAHAHITYRKNL
jgi:hypothetical protein